MKRILIIINLVISQTLMAQITLKECIETGLVNQPNINRAKSDVLLTKLQSVAVKAAYLPQISIAYDYRYNTIIPTQVVPVGQFNPIPTDETRGIQFGTPWQQNAGISVYQPVIDFTTQKSIKESNINETLASIDLKIAEDKLTYEIADTYSRIIIFKFQLEEAMADTVRSYRSYTILNDGFEEGKVLKMELNNAIINHNNNINQYKKVLAAGITEKIYMHYLTNIALERVLEDNFQEIPARIIDASNTNVNFQTESSFDYQKLLRQEKLLNQQIKTERTKYLPRVGFQGFLGANQFSQVFNPWLNNTWFGNSYVGLALELSLFSPDKSINAEKQLRTQLTIVNTQKDELKLQKNKDLLQLNIEINQLKQEIAILDNNLKLISENIQLYQERVKNGQFASAELNVQEVEIQKINNQVKQRKEQLNKAFLQRIYISGQLSDYVKKL
ncbi:MAG: TolC family protein [Thermonemataceae bacterium]